MEYRSYTLEEIESIADPIFSGNQETVPLSPHRITSYRNNPRANSSDKVLFVCLDGHKLVAFRTLLPDQFLNTKGQVSKCAWLSGNFVEPHLRRQGISTKLLQLAEEQWDGMLLYTNYAPASRSVYDHTGRFPLFKERPGQRFYLRASLEELWGKRMRSPGLLRFTDHAINSVREKRLNRRLVSISGRCEVKMTGIEDPGIVRIVDHSMASSLFGRDSRVMKWILDYPWLTEDPRSAVAYPFSHVVSKFRNRIYYFRSQEHGGEGWMWLVEHNRKTTVPYFHFTHPDLSNEMISTLLSKMIAGDSGYISIRHPELVAGLQEYRRYFLGVRNMPQLIFAHKKLLPLLDTHAPVYDGDGDVAFTG